MAVLQLLRLAQHSELYPAAGVILGAIVANLLHWGIASINGMAVAAVCYCVGQAVNKRK